MGDVDNADLGGRTLDELEHDIDEKWARPDRETMLALIARVREAERERDEACRLHSEAEAQVACRNELRWQLAQVRAQVDTMIATHDEVEKRAEAAEARVKELEVEQKVVWEKKLFSRRQLEAEVAQLRAVRDAAEAVLVYEWGDPAKGCTVGPGDSVWLALRAALAAARGTR